MRWLLLEPGALSFGAIVGVISFCISLRHREGVIVLAGRMRFKTIHFVLRDCESVVVLLIFRSLFIDRVTDELDKELKRDAASTDV